MDSNSNSLSTCVLGSKRLDCSLPNQVYLLKLKIVNIETSIDLGVGNRVEIVINSYRFLGGFDVICCDGEINTLSNK